MPRRTPTAPTPPPVELDYIAEPLRQFAVPIDSLNPDPDNPRVHDQLNLEAITASLSQFGQQIPIIVQKDGRVVRIGNGRLKAAKAMGWTHIAALITDQPDAVSKALGIADNRTAELAQWDMAALARQIDELQEEAPELIESVGFEMRAIESLLNRYLPNEPDSPPADPVFGPEGTGSGDGAPNGRSEAGNAAPGTSAGMSSPVLGVRYIYLSYQEEEYAEFVELIRFFGQRYDTAVTPEAVIQALREFKGSIQ